MAEPVFFDPQHKAASLTRLGLAFAPLVGVLIMALALVL
ncbi:MAG: hypothetical protein QOJ27_673 [Sphingomonadales bacterium]|nr:hypothetical protein [Sphingomonadales bacterium]